jgi:hypothetical protein
MSNLLRKGGDRLLGLFLSTARAGACVPEHGLPCSSCTCKVVSGRVVCYRNKLNCTGTACNISTSCCC